MAAQAQRTTVEALLEREARQRPLAARDGGTTDDSSGVSGLNAVWRQKVVHWYFTLVSALQRQHDAAAVSPAATAGSTSSDPNPFDRAAVHVSASLLDGYIMSLPSERALRYKHDRPAYQLLATTCLLLGMRLAMHDRVKDARRDDEGKAEQQQCGLKRAKAKMTNMNEAAATTPSSAATAMPNAATILRISAAPKSMSEQQVLSMVREMTGSRAFPRSRVVTALDYIAALGGTRTELSQDGSSITLGPAEAEEASRIADILLQRDATFLSCAPSAVACAVITMALARSDASAHLDVSSLRQRVFRSIFGPEADQALVGAVLQAESKILVGAPASRNHARRVVPTTHLIPLEDE